MDPEMLFRYRYDTLSKSATGLESFLYKYIPMNLVKSFAFAIDPAHKFKVAPSTITAVNRTRKRATDSVLLDRRWRKTHTTATWSQVPNYQNVSICSSPYYVFNDNSDPPTTGNLADQPVLVDYIKDTTSRTRIIGSTQGELEFFKATLFSPPRTTSREEKYRQITNGVTPSPQCSAVGGMRDGEIGGDQRWSVTHEPIAATLSKSTYDALVASEVAKANALSVSLAPRLYMNANPHKREYSLARNAAELKDLARSMISARRTADDLKKLWSSLQSQPKLRSNVFDLAHNAASNVPSEYLSFHFGWKQLYRDLDDLLHLPEKLSKRINFLIKRSGLATTYRSKLDTISSDTGVPGFTYSTEEYDQNTTVASRIERISETRIVINATFDFPPSNVPHFRQRFFADKIGLIPRFTDVYNIIPWSWLVDWFTGFGNYLEMIEEINHDPKLINWGMITTKTSGKLVTEFKSDNRHRRIYSLNGVGGTTDSYVANRHTSVMEFEVQTRKNVASVLGVKQTTIPSTLSAYQLSILGAILAQRIDNTRSGTFRPRS
jgi:hypothetical protein